MSNKKHKETKLFWIKKELEALYCINVLNSKTYKKCILDAEKNIDEYSDIDLWEDDPRTIADYIISKYSH